nr:GntP family permease [Ancylobacter crimeensis]
MYQAAFLLIAILFVAVACWRGRLHPLIAVVLGAVGFGLAAGMATSQIGKSFGIGFSQSIQSLGLVVLAGALIGEIADGAGATSWLNAKTALLSRRAVALLMPALGLLGGIASSPAAAYALLGPLRRALRGDSPRPALILGLSLSAAHGALLPAPVMIAAVTILGASWWAALGFGIPLALLGIAIGTGFARLAVPRVAAPPEAPEEVADPGLLHRPKRAAQVLLLVSAVVVTLLAIQSLGDIASEPFGGGPNREFILGLGRPLMLLVVGVGLMALLARPWQRDGLSEDGWAGRGISRVATLILLIGMAGGLQKLIQDTGLPEMNAERLTAWVPAQALMLALPFALAAVMKTLQGSSLVAAITAAGMMAPLLVPVGLDGASGRALAALAVGAGSMTAPLITDGLFWLVGSAMGAGPAGTLARFSLGTVIQGLASLGLLILLHVVFT